jgi:hypothetical protein
VVCGFTLEIHQDEWTLAPSKSLKLVVMDFRLIFGRFCASRGKDNIPHNMGYDWDVRNHSPK